MTETDKPAQPIGGLPRFDLVFLDMDGVLSDFQGAACKLHQKLSPSELASKNTWPPCEWNMPKVFGLSKEKFWGKIDETPNFWHDMPMMPHCLDVLGVARGIADSVRVLTTPHDHAECYAGKFEWCRRVLNITPYLCREKHLLARPGRLLIDDSDENCDAFRAAGGSAILFPQHWNSAHDKAPFGPLFYLAQELGKLAAEQNAQKVQEAMIATRCYWDDKDGLWRRESDDKPFDPNTSGALHLDLYSRGDMAGNFAASGVE